MAANSDAGLVEDDSPQTVCSGSGSNSRVGDAVNLQRTSTDVFCTSSSFNLSSNLGNTNFLSNLAGSTVGFQPPLYPFGQGAAIPAGMSHVTNSQDNVTTARFPAMPCQQPFFQ